jgi:pimeloyl-ACP methyl ester carboxylesterase
VRYPLQQITVSGIRLQYIEVHPSQPSSEPPLFLLHQLLATAETLSELIRQLPSDRHIVALDILSAAPIDQTPLDLTANALSTLIAQFLQAIQLANPIVIGHSYGGELALWLASVHEVPLAGLALLCPAHPFEGYRRHVVAFYLTRWGRFLALCIPIAPRFAILWAYNQAAGPTDPITARHLEPHLRVLRHRDTLRRVLQILSTWETDMSILRKALTAKPIILPTLLLWGDHDEVVPPESARGLEAVLPAFEHITLPGCGHLLPEEASEACGKLITTWLIWLKTDRRHRLVLKP